MVEESYRHFFNRAFGWEPDDPERGPYPYQTALAEEPWPDLLDVPTGLGKTAAVVLAWLWKRGWRVNGRAKPADSTPRRLVYCLPMRVLVEQTFRNVDWWLEKLGVRGDAGEGRVSVHILMGGEEDLRSWTEHPEEDVVLIGTQDMLMSRALMRGYGISRYQWPVHFALLHNDALWVYDEVQLMGPALATSAQLEGMRRGEGMQPAANTRSLWLSATLNPEWLDTIDLRPHRKRLRKLELSNEETINPQIRLRREAAKDLRPAQTRLTPDHLKKKQALQDYAEALAEEVLAYDDASGDTLVVLNTVERAQTLYDALLEKAEQRREGDAAGEDAEEPVEIILVHARFRPAERRAIERRLEDGRPLREASSGSPPARGRIIVSTQAIEAGVDLTSSRLFTELAPWSSVVQRFGRCNRYGENEYASVLWIDVELDEKTAAPYDPEALEAARILLASLTTVSPAVLPATQESAPVGQVLRRRDLLDLFNNEPDLSGFDVDISPYIRDSGIPQVHVFWREFGEEPGEQARPAREELCPVSVARLRNHLKRASAYTYDGLADSWRRTSPDRIIPGATVMLRADDGGYSNDRGFTPGSKTAVEVIGGAHDHELPYDGDPHTTIGYFVKLAAHLEDVADEADALCRSLPMDNRARQAVVTAAHRHDVGKAHPAFQNALRNGQEPISDRTEPRDRDGPAGNTVPGPGDTIWAKSPGTGRLDYRIEQGGGKVVVRRPRFRHELASMLAWLEHGNKDEMHDLIAYLIAAHHGKIRMGLRALPDEEEPPDKRRFARGIWEGDLLPPLRLNGESIPETELRLDVMELGWSEQGPSWTERTQSLLAEQGPFRLAWMEALVRVADWRASQKERELGPSRPQ